MSEATLLESRVSKVEQDNRRLKLTLGALLLVLTGAACAGAMMPEQMPEVIQARAFEVIDENGVRRALMVGEGIFYYGANGATRARMSNSFEVRDENGEIRAMMNDVSIRVLGENGTLRAWMDDNGFAYQDENGNVVWRTPDR